METGPSKEIPSVASLITTALAEYTPGIPFERTVDYQGVPITIRLTDSQIDVQAHSSETVYYYTANRKEDTMDQSSRLVILDEKRQDKRGPLPHLTELTGLALTHLERDTPVQKLASDWMDMPTPNTRNVNFNTYQEAKKSLPPEEAAFQTPSGKVARRYGFTQVEVTETSYGQIPVIRTLFSRPTPDPKTP